MSAHGYVLVQWNRRKKVYDISLWIGIALYIGVFMLISSLLYPGAAALSPMILLIRAFSTLAFSMLTLILCIGPLARLDSRFLPLLYNRRHMGVSMFLIALTHAILAINWYHSFGVGNPIASIFNSPGSFSTAADIPFQPFGFLALLILFVMAATSHDYWNRNLSAQVWKALHMGVYLAYGLLVIHVAYGAMQDDRTGLLPLMVFASVLLVGGLHIVAGIKSRHANKETNAVDWVDVGRWSDIENNRAITVSVGSGERVAIYRYEEIKLAAVSNVCKHQNGPLGEGMVMDGCITCPWHGFQYRPEDGRAPEPFTERIATYELKLDEDRLLLNPNALAEGTARPVLDITSVRENGSELHEA